MKTISLKKKVAAVAVASLGLGLLSVAPARAANDNIATDLVDVASATASVPVGTAASTVVSVSLAAGTTDNDGDTTKVLVAVTTKPTDSTVAVANADGANSGATANVLTNTGNDAKFNDAASSQSSGIFTATQTAAVGTSIGASDTVAIGTLSITPDKPGVYVVTLTGKDTDGTTNLTGANVKTFTVYAGYSIDAANPTNAFPTQGVNIASGWSTTAGGVATVRLTNYPATAAVRHFVTASGCSIITATINNNSNGANAITKDGTTTYVVNLTNGANLTGGVDFIVGTSTTRSDSVDIQVQSASTGSCTITDTFYDATTGSATVYAKAVLTVGSASALAGGTSTSVLGSGTGNPAVTGVDDVVTADATAGTQRANVLVTLKDQYSNPVYGQTLSATISGPGLIKWSQATQATAGSVRADSLVLTASQNTAYLGINGDGQGGVATITITVGTTVIATEKVTFFGSATKLVAKAAKPFLSVGANADALEVLATDANGAVANFTVTALSDNISAVSSTVTNCARATDAEVLLGYTSGAYYCDLNGVALGKAKLTVAPGATATNSPVVEYQVTGSVAYGVKLSTDKAAYAPGEKITLTISATDIAGNPIGAGSYDFLNGASTASQALTGTAFTDAAFAFNGGKATTTYYAPLIAGPFSFTAALNNSGAVAAAIASTNVTTTATVAADTTVQTQIASLIAAIAKLQKAINKIQKRLARR